jgi:hypothetical protein
MIDKPALERELLELCDRVAGARGRYSELLRQRDLVQGINSFMNSSVRDAKQVVADQLYTAAMQEDRLWRELIVGCVTRIMEM